MKKLFSLVLTVVILFGVASPAMARVEFATYDDKQFQVYDVNGKNADVEARRKAIEERFGIQIRYDMDDDGSACIGTGSLAVLENTLAAITPEVVRQVSSFYQNRVGNKITYYFTYSPFQRLALDYDILGSFEYTTATVELYLPSYAGSIYMTGDSPLTIAHEFGHAYWAMWTEFYGTEKFRREWTAMNDGARYYGTEFAEIYDEYTFPSLYGATAYEEDFAEVFAHAFVRNKAGLGMIDKLVVNNQWTSLGKKVNYLEKMLGFYLDNTAAAVSNYKRIYSAPVTLQYQDSVYSGDYLQFMGCAQPRYILRTLLAEMGVTAQSQEWILEIGGWRVLTGTGHTMIVFPGGRSFYESSVAVA